MSNPDFSGSYPPDPAEPGRWSRSRDGQRGERYGDGGRARGTQDAGDGGYRRDRDYEWDRGAGADPAYARADRPRADSPRAGNRRAVGGRNGGSRADQRGADQRGADQQRADQGWASQSRASQSRASQSWEDQGRADQGRPARGSRRAARDAGRGRRGTAGAGRAASGMSAKDRLVAKLGTDHAASGFSAAGAADYASGGAPAAAHAMTSGYPGSADPRGPGPRDSGPRWSGGGRGGAARMHDGNGRGGRGGNGGGGRGGNGRGPGRPRRKGDWWRRWTWKKALAASALTGVGFIILIVIGIFYTYSQTPIPAASQLATGQASRVYFRDGHTLVGRFGNSDRQTLQPNQIPAMVSNAMVAAEDKHFYDEGGVSPLGIMRAAIADLTSGSVQQGGSTITQQLVRNYYTGIGTAETATRKIKEIFVAEKLASVESKAWILTNYMNTVPTGVNMYGFGAASEAYFGKPVSKLTVAQAAMIAAMPQSPSYYNPDPKAGAAYQALVFRWHYVLRTMVQMGTLTQAQANAQKFPTLAKAFNNSWSGYRGYIMTAVLNELENTYHYTQGQIDDGGLRVVTTFSKPMMNQLYATVAQEKRQMKLDGKALPSYAHVGAVLEAPNTGQIWAMYSGPNYNAPTKQCARIRCQWDMALQNREQVGSSMKPYVLALARSQGMSVKTSTLDGHSPLWIPPVSQPSTYASQSTPANSSQWYEVGNDAGDAQANGVSVVTASAESLNTAYTDLYHRVAGTDGMNMINMAKSFGVNVSSSASGLFTQRDEVGTALGQASLTVEEQASTFATLANNGQYNAPHVILQIQQQLPGQAMQTIQAKVAHHQVLTPDENSDVDYALSFDDKPGGTAPNVGLADGRELIAKTGTTNLSQSAFFIGAIPQFSLAIGMFTNEQGCPTSIAGCAAAANQESAPPAGLQTLYGVGNLPGYGGEWPATIWHAYAQKMFGSMPVQAFPTPDFGGTAWNMLGPYTPKPKPVVIPTPTPTNTCKGFFFAGRCFHGQGNNPKPTPTPTTPIPTSSFPSTTPTLGTQRSTIG
ncbi:MAG TPA: transglycosylase domain-containing protein [Streptosporangiaceae bacterium]|nr:transglycosylase domain-containing protein [Streptosporangiaceae bacterium]